MFRALDVRQQGSRLSILSVMTFLALLTPNKAEEGERRTSTLPTALEHDQAYHVFYFLELQFQNEFLVYEFQNEFLVCKFIF